MNERDVWCLTCHAEPGEPCQNGYGGPAVFMHTVRRDWGGNSARRGFATEATVNDASDLSVMRHGRWNWARTMHTYAEDPGDPWANNPARRLGL